MALFAIVIASSVIVVSGGLVGSAFAVTEKVTNQNAYSMVPIISLGQDKSSFPMSQSANDVGGDDSSDNTYQILLPEDKSSFPMSQSANPDDSEWTTADTNAIPAKDLKSLSKCESSAAADGDLILAEVIDCYHQVF
jgi:hypothetical protein